MSTHERAAAIVQWVERHHEHRLNPAIREQLFDVLARGHEYRTFVEYCEATGQGDSTVRYRLRKKQLPAASAWLRLARALYIADLYRSGMRAEDVGRLMGYQDHSGASKAVRSCFRTPLEATRQMERGEWAPLVRRWWLQRAAAQ